MHTFERNGRFTPSAAGESARDAARDFARLFGPVVYALARRRGLGDADAADLMREVLTHAAGGEQLLADGGTIRARLVTAARTALAAPGREAELDTDWEAEFERQLARCAMAAVKREVPTLDWEAFWRAAVDGRSAATVGRELGMTPGAVHVVKCQVLARLSEGVQRLRLEAESWGGPAPSADRTRPTETAIYPAVLAPDDADGTPLHTPCCSGRWC